MVNHYTVQLNLIPAAELLHLLQQENKIGVCNECDAKFDC